MPFINNEFLKTLEKPDKNDVVYWDEVIKGFGLRIQNGTASYVFYYRNEYRRQKKITIGKASKMTPYFAREQAKKILAEVIQGKDPAEEKQANRHALTVSELCDWYLQEGTEHKKASTIENDKGRINAHIKPLIGNMPVKAIKRGDIQKLYRDISSGEKIKRRIKLNKPRALSCVKGGPGTARRTIGMLGAIFQFAIYRDIVQVNPCHNLQMKPYKKRDLFLTLDDIRRFGELLNRPDMLATQKKAMEALKLIALTGCRKSEIEGLRWEWVDLKAQCFRFPDTKTGQQTRPFGLGALHQLKALPSQKSGWVFPASVGDGHMDVLHHIFQTLNRQKDQLGQPYVKKGMGVHTLRHSFASIGAEMGFSDFTIAGLLGHSLHTTTSRYMHSIDKSLIHAADTISLAIEDALNGNDNTEKQTN